MSYRSVKPAHIKREGYTFRNLPPSNIEYTNSMPSKLEWYWGVVCCQTCFLCILYVRNVEGISLANIVRKNNTLHHYPTPYPPSCVYHLARIWIQAVTSKYSNCISYNFFIFCPICMKFSHKFLHTYCFIFCIKMKKSKISENWVASW